MKNKKNIELWFSLLLLFLTFVISVISYQYWYDLLFFIGSLFFVHWIGLIATIFIAILVPTYYILKRKKPKYIKKLLKIHVFGNLLSYLFISIHFSQNTGRLSQLFLRLEDGFIFFIVLSVLIVTGMIERFGRKPNLSKYIKSIHRYGVFLFYLIMLIHTLQGFNLI